jgi:23S rRNA pseudouridine955/2504/2580 synthase
MREIIISQNEAGQRVNKFLLKYLNKAPSSFVYKMIRKKNIKLNNKKIEGNEIIYIGDVVQIYMAEDTIGNFREEVSEAIAEAPKDFKLEVIYSDENILIANKPVGMLSQKADKKDYSINEAVIDYLLNNNKITKQQLNTFKPSICNRLDRNTSGVILCGVSLTGSQELSRIIRERLVEKYYYTIVRGRMKSDIDSQCYISKNEETNTATISDEPSDAGKWEAIHTVYQPIKSNGDYTLLKVKLITGKTHQIRAHLQYLGYPVVGDNKYGIPEVNRYFRDKYKLRNQLLHCGNVIFDNIEGPLSYLNGKEYSAFLPDIFKNIVKELFQEK